MRRPIGVSLPCVSTAPRSARTVSARWSALSSGFSYQGKVAASPQPEESSSRIVSERSTRLISGTSRSGRASWSVCDQRRMQRPGPVRPARPARCSADACETGSTSKVSMPRCGSKRAIRARPASTTARTPGIVSDVSATLVATMTLRPGLGLTARSCSSGGSSP